MHRLPLLVLMSLAACAAAGGKQRVGIDQIPPGSKCVQSGALDSFKGQVASTDLAARIMTAARAPKLRWVPWGAIITMEFSESRVTVRLDQANRVISATCG